MIIVRNYKGEDLRFVDFCYGTQAPVLGSNEAMTEMSGEDAWEYLREVVERRGPVVSVEAFGSRARRTIRVTLLGEIRRTAT